MIDNIWKDVEVTWRTPTNKRFYSEEYSEQRFETSELFEDSLLISSNYKSESKVINSKLYAEENYNEEEKDRSLPTKSEHFQTPIALFENSNIDMSSMKSEYKMTFSNREDVLNKGAIRVVRKYYRDTFKNMNKHIVKRRIINCKSKDIIEATEALWRGLFPIQSCNIDLYYYLAGILKLKSTSRMHKCSNEVKEEIKTFLDCSRMYSKSKFRSLFHSKSFRLIWKHVVEQDLYQDKTEWMKQLLKIYKD